MAGDTLSMTDPAQPSRGRSTESLLRSELERLRAHLERHPGALGGSASAGDVAQEAAARVLERKEKVAFGSPSELRAYLWQTARRLIVDRWRRRRRKQSIEELDSLASCVPAGPPIEIGDGRSDALMRALEKLTFQDRRVLELAYLHDATVGEIAAELGISVPAVKMRLSRARERLRERLGIE